MDEVNEQKALTYLVPTGSIGGDNNRKYYSEHKVFLIRWQKYIKTENNKEKL